MALLIVGLALVALGLFAGSVLVASAFGMGSAEPSATLWLLFPAFSVSGYLLFVMGARVATIRWLSAAVSYVLLALAVASAAGLVLSAAALGPVVASTTPLWYVLAIAGTLGTLGAAAHHKAGPGGAVNA